MQLSLRIGLIIGAVLMLAFVLYKIRRKQLSTNDSVFWFFFAGILVLVAIIPEIFIFLAGFIGIQSPANLVFLVILAIVIIRLLMLSVDNARLKSKLNDIVQKIALEESEK